MAVRDVAAVLLVTAEVDSRFGSKVFNILFISPSLVKDPKDWKIFVIATPGGENSFDI